MSRVEVLLLSLVLLGVTTSVALAQGPAYRISCWSLNAGSTLTGGGYRLSAIAGQPEVSIPLSGQGYTLIGGFRPSCISGGVLPNPTGGPVYLPIILRNP